MNSTLLDIKLEIPTQSPLWIIFELKKLLGLDINEGPWIVGGAPMKIYIGGCLLNGDIDIFCSSQEQHEKCRKILYDYVKYKFIGRHLDDNGYLLSLFDENYIITTNNAITFIDSTTGYKFQLISKFMGETIQDIFDSFDFDCCKIATDGKNLYGSEKTFSDVDRGIIDLTGEANEFSLKRLQKYGLQYDFKPTDQTIEKIRKFGKENNWGFEVHEGY